MFEQLLYAFFFFFFCLEEGEADMYSAAQSCSGRGNKVRQSMPEKGKASQSGGSLVLSHFHRFID